MGCFAEKTYYQHDVITLYLGHKLTITEDAKHCDFPHVLAVTSKISLNHGASGKELLLGGHKCNDTKLESVEHVKKRKGRTIRNNAYLEGINIIASKKILIGMRFSWIISHAKKVSTRRKNMNNY